MPNKGLLLTMTETPPALEAEFNDWYDAEHLPERLAIPGFMSARRWACEQLVPGDASPDPAARALLLACGEVPTERMPLPAKVLSARHFLASSGEPRYIGLYELGGKDIALPRSSGDWLLQVYRKYEKKN